MQQNLSVPIAIVIAGAFIALALFFAGRTAVPSPDAPAPANDATAAAKKAALVTPADHILGNPDADIMIVEYSDIECPFCKQFHVTMKQIIQEYGESGQVAWVYRHFPLAQLHPNAPRLAEASECVAELAGNAGFWKFLDEIFALAPGNSLFPMDQLTATAVKAGADGSAFESCLTSGKYKDKVQAQFNNAIESGGQGTPHNVIITKDGQFVPLSGAQPYATVKGVIDSLLAQ